MSESVTITQSLEMVEYFDATVSMKFDHGNQNVYETVQLNGSWKDFSKTVSEKSQRKRLPHLAAHWKCIITSLNSYQLYENGWVSHFETSQYVFLLNLVVSKWLKQKYSNG